MTSEGKLAAQINTLIFICPSIAQLLKLIKPVYNFSVRSQFGYSEYLSIIGNLITSLFTVFFQVLHQYIEQHRLQQRPLQ